MRTIATSLTCLIIGLLGTTFAQQSVVGLPYVDHFSSEDYGGGMQNYSIVQDSRGLIYVGNNFGLLEYDGNDWEKFGIAKGTKIRSAYASPEGRIYMGAQNEFGYLETDSNGTFLYHSLHHLIPESNINFNDIWKIYPYQGGIIFAEHRTLFYYRDHTIITIPKDGATGFTYKVNGRLYTPFEEGIKVLDKGKWEPIINGSFFKKYNVSGIIPFNKETMLVSTYENGLFQMSRNKVRPWGTGLTRTFAQKKINKLIRLKSGQLAIGTNSDGLYLVNSNEEINLHLTEGKGLKNSSVVELFEDSFGNIWVGLNNGIAKVHWQAPFRIIDEQIGLKGTGYAGFENDTHLFLGTNLGLFSAQKSDIESQERPIGKNTAIHGQIHSIQNIDGDILVAGHFGAYQIKGEETIQISDELGWWIFKETEKPGTAIGGTYNGLFLLKRKNGIWKVEKKYENFLESSRVLEFDNNGKLWMSHGYKGVFSFEFSSDYNSITSSKFYGVEDGLPTLLLNNVFKISGEIIFTTAHGIFRFEESSQKFVRHPKFDNLFGPNSRIRVLNEDSFGNIYFIATGHSGVLRKSSQDEYQLEPNLFNNLLSQYNDDLEKITILNDQNVLFAAKSGFIHYARPQERRPLQKTSLLFRSILLSRTDSTLYGGSAIKPSNSRQTLEYIDNSINFSYAAVDFNQSSTQYRFRLKNFEEDWSAWTTKTEKEYTNLNEGDYDFEVQAKDIFDNRSSIITYKFNIQPPFYRAPLAYLLYLLLSVSTIVGLMKRSGIKHQKEKTKILQSQAKELDKKKFEVQEIAHKSQAEIDRLKNEKLVEKIRHKRKELAATTMHLIDKNDLIGSVKNQISEMVKTDKAKGLKVELKRIIKEIDQNLDSDNDWSQFELHFDEVHNNFLKRIKSHYPAFTPQDVKLSAYLKMNMSTKEIANLLKISVRGVEIARYRLRKKLDINTSENLVDFMLNFDKTH